MKLIKSFNLDFSDLGSAVETRRFVITGDANAEFILEIKNADNYYYNFTTKTFSSTKSKLEGDILGGGYRGEIKFQAITDADQYDISLSANPGILHVKYVYFSFGVWNFRYKLIYWI